MNTDQIELLYQKLYILESLVRGAICFIQEYEIDTHVANGLYYGFYDFKEILESILDNIDGKYS